jgi:hypothetical protein
MAGTTTDTDVLAVERESCLRMIEARGRRGPVNHVEVCAVVIRVAFHTTCASRSRSRKCSMEAFVLLHLISDLTVALETFERGCTSGHFMALDAIGASVQVLVGLCQRTGRDLRTRDRLCLSQDEEKQGCHAT